MISHAKAAIVGSSERRMSRKCSVGLGAGASLLFVLAFLALAPAAFANGKITVEPAPGSTGKGLITGGEEGTALGDLHCEINGASSSGDCTMEITAPFEELEFRAAPEGGATFLEWEATNALAFSACNTSQKTNVSCIGAMGSSSADSVLKAKFAAPPNVTVEAAPETTGAGTVTAPSSDPLNCHIEGATASGDCTSTITGVFEEFEFHATPDTGSVFVEWIGTGALAANECNGSKSPNCEAVLGAAQIGTLKARFALATPSLTIQPANPIEPYAATLNGTVNPNGKATTDCHFEYVTHEAFLAAGFTDLSSGGTAPCAPDPGSGSSAVPVSAAVNGLHGGTAYEYRLLATNANGTSETATQSFVTLAIAFADAATTVHRTDVVLNGHLDPSGDPEITSCEFDWGTDTTYSGGTITCEQGNSFTGPTSVGAFLNDLSAGTTYHYRLRVTTTNHGESTSQDNKVTMLTFPTLAPEEITSFGPDGTSASSFSFLSPRALAFNSAAATLFASGGEESGIYGFDASSPPAFTPLSSFAPLAVPPADRSRLAVDSTSLPSAGNLYYYSTTTDLIYGFNSSGAPLGGNFPIDVETNPGISQRVAGLAVDAAGHLWVSNSPFVGSEADRQLLRYSSTGTFEFSRETPNGGHERRQPERIAFGPDDDLYVTFEQQTIIYKYTAASNYAVGSASKVVLDNDEVNGLAVDPTTGVIYVAASFKLSAYEAQASSEAGQLLYRFGQGSGAFYFDVALDTTTGDIYAADVANKRIRVFAPGVVKRQPTVTTDEAGAVTGDSVTLNGKVDPETFEVTDCHFELVPGAQFEEDAYASVTPEEEHPCEQSPGSGSGDVAVSADVGSLNGGSAYHFRIVASNANPNGTATGADVSFETTGPIISGESADNVADTTATLHAQINPQGQETTWQFEYTTEEAFESEGFTGAATAPATPATIEAGPSAVAVTQGLTGLQPETTYRFRAVASNVEGTDHGFGGSFTTYASTHSFHSCANDSFRTGASAALPDCRAYEQVSPMDKNGGSVQHTLNLVQAAADGSRLSFGDASGLPTSGGSSHPSPYIASRGGGEWSTAGTLPLLAQGMLGSVAGWSPNLSTSFSGAGNISRAGGGNSSQVGLYLGDTASETWHLVYPGATTVGAVNPNFVRIADDGSQVLFEGDAALAPGAVEGKLNLYALEGETVTLAGRVPPFPASNCDDETHAPDCVAPAQGSFAGPYGETLAEGGPSKGYYPEGMASADGSKVFFTEAGTGRLYMREDNARTVQVSASQAPSPDPNGHKPALWVAATPSGSKVFFTSCEKLTGDSTAVSTSASSCTESGQGSDLYSYDTESGQLTDLTVDSNADPHGADVHGVLGASADGSDVYFAANGVLASGATSAGCCNVYLSHEGTVSFIAHINDSADWHPNISAHESKTSRVSANGALLFGATENLGPYDSHGKEEFYRYAPDDSGPSCVSCNPTGVAPLNGASLEEIGISFSHMQQFLTRNISADGKRVFFNSADALVGSDVNGRGGCPVVGEGSGEGLRACSDVYEWEAKGSGSCESEAENGGCLYLISSGTSTEGVSFGDASESGDDVFFFTSQSLVPQDGDSALDAYDARVQGGLASQHPQAPAACEGEACRGEGSTSPASQGAGTAAFQGPGNPPAEKIKKHKKHRRKHHHRRAHAKRGGAK